MKTVLVIFSIIALALSGCATGYYHRGYSGYNSGYAVQRYYDYGPSYYSPGTSFIYERSYVQPGFDYGHREHEYYQDRRPHQGWQPTMQQPKYFGGHGDWNDRHDGGMSHQFAPDHRGAGQTPNWAIQPQPHQPMSEPQRRGFDGNRGYGDSGLSQKLVPSHRDVERTPNFSAQPQPHQRQPMPEQHRQDFGANRGHGDGGHRGRQTD